MHENYAETATHIEKELTAFLKEIFTAPHMQIADEKKKPTQQPRTLAFYTPKI